MAKQKHARKKPDSLLPPDQYTPAAPRDLIGPARSIAGDLLRHTADLKRSAHGQLKLLLYGPWGDGKSTIAALISRALTAHPIDVEKINGRNVSIELVREWQRNTFYGSLFGGWKVKFIEETDLIPLLAQDLMLTFLDDLPPRNAIIGTSNLNLETLGERFQTRFRLVKVEGPGAGELSRFLQSWPIPKATADFIALGAAGNVRAALLDAADYLTFGEIRHRPKPPVVVKDAAASARALKAWDTMRGRSAA